MPRLHGLRGWRDASMHLVRIVVRVSGFRNLPVWRYFRIKASGLVEWCTWAFSVKGLGFIQP